MSRKVWQVMLLFVALAGSACAHEAGAQHSVAVQIDQGTGGAGGGY